MNPLGEYQPIFTLDFPIELSRLDRGVGGPPFGLEVPQRIQLGTAPKIVRSGIYIVGLLHIGGWAFASEIAINV